MDERQKITSKLNEVMAQIKKERIKEHDVPLHDGAGIVMKRYHSKAYNGSDCTLTIVDHNVTCESITPRRIFSEKCVDCRFYPCATGLLNLTLRADGMLSYCRLRMDTAVSIKKLSDSKIKQTINEMLTPFSKCSER